MAQIQSPETYADGQQVTAARLNNQTNGAILLPGAVTDQTAIATNTVASGDQVILHDASASALRKATAGDLLGSGIPVVTPSVTGTTGADLVLTPAAGQKVDVAGNMEADDINVTDDLTVGDDASIGGDLTVAGTTTLTGNAVANGNLSVAGSFTYGGNIPQKQLGLAFLTRELTPNLQYFLTPAGVWNDLPYNTLAQVNPFVVNSASFTGVLSSAGSGIITLPAGSYMIDAELSIQSQGGGAEMTMRLFNNTSSTVIKNGRQTTCNSYVNARALVSALVTLTVETQIKIQYYTNAVANTNYGASMIGAPAPTLSEVVCTAKIMKLV